MKKFQFYKKAHPQDPNIFLLESDDITIIWGKTCCKEIFDYREHTLQWNRNNQDYNSRHYFSSLFSITGNIEYNSHNNNFLIQNAQHSFLSLQNLSFTVTKTPVEHKKSFFFKFSFSKKYFESHFLKDSAILNNIANQMSSSTFCWAGYSMSISASMRVLIEEIINQPYKGSMTKMFIESKILELYLLQVYSFDFSECSSKQNLTPLDVQKIYAAENYITNNMNKKTSIVLLSKIIGINQTKLKNGFKQLFGDTIHNYTFKLKMCYAKKLLEEGEKSLLNISELVGYSHPNHFSYAFKSKHGVSPSSFRMSKNISPPLQWKNTYYLTTFLKDKHSIEGVNLIVPPVNTRYKF